MNIWPYTNFHEMNLDWILQAIKDMNEELRTFINVNTIKYADPIKWDITRQYEANTVVVDEAGAAYLSVKAVPSGISISRKEYWTEIGNFSTLWISFKSGITPYDVGASTTATDNYPVNTLVWVKDTLRIVTKAMMAGDKFTDSNSTLTSVNAELEKLRTRMTMAETNLAKEIADRKAADETLTNSVHQNENAIANEITARQEAVTAEANARIKADEALQNRLDNFSVTYTNALDTGIIANQPSSAESNTTILQKLLDNGTVVYFPAGTYYLSSAIYMRRPCGILGANMRSSTLYWPSGTDGIIYDLEYNKQWMYDKIYFTINLQNIALRGCGATLGAGRGLYIRNKTFVVDCNSDSTAYNNLKGDGYALECRNSPIQNIMISDWTTGIDSSYYIAYVSIANAFIDTCDLGIHALFSDSILANVVVTFCYNGILAESESNKWNNIALKMNGYRANYDTRHPQNNSIALHLYNEKHSSFTNIEVQESYANGVIIEHLSNNLVFSNITVDSNGFKQTASNDVGLQVMDNCTNIRGTIIALNKNTQKTQRLGLYVDETCKNILFSYTESEQKVSAWSIGGNTAKACSNDRLSNVISYAPENFTPSQRSVVWFDGRNLGISIHGYFTTTYASGSKFNIANVFGGIPYSALKYTTFAAVNTTNLSLLKMAVDNTDCTLVADSQIPSSSQVDVDIVIPIFV